MQRSRGGELSVNAKTAALAALVLVIAVIAWRELRPAKGCPEGMNVSGRLTDGKTGEDIGFICQGPIVAD
jgi:hypothetical protein